MGGLAQKSSNGHNNSLREPMWASRALLHAIVQSPDFLGTPALALASPTGNA